MILKLEKNLFCLCDLAVSSLNEYRKELDKRVKKDIKAYTSEHFSFLCVLTDIVRQADAVLLEITEEIKKAEAENEPEKSKNFTSLFDRGILLKNTLENYFRASDNIFKEDDFLIELKKLTDATMRKMIAIRNTQDGPIL